MENIIEQIVSKVEPFKSDPETKSHFIDFFSKKLDEEGIRDIQSITEDLIRSISIDAEQENYILPKHVDIDTVSADLIDEFNNILPLDVDFSNKKVNPEAKIIADIPINTNEQDQDSFNKVNNFFEEEATLQGLSSIIKPSEKISHTKIGATKKEIKSNKAPENLNDEHNIGEKLSGIIIEHLDSYIALHREQIINSWIQQSEDNFIEIKEALINALRKSILSDINETVITNIIKEKFHPIIESYMSAASYSIKSQIDSLAHNLKLAENLQHVPQQLEHGLIAIKNKFVNDNKDIITSQFDKLENKIEQGVTVKRELNKTQNFILFSCALCALAAVLISIIGLIGMKDIYYGYTQYQNISKTIKSLPQNSQQEILRLISNSPLKND